jgi:hypothetical protein
MRMARAVPEGVEEARVVCRHYPAHHDAVQLAHVDGRQVIVCYRLILCMSILSGRSRRTTARPGLAGPRVRGGRTSCCNSRPWCV